METGGSASVAARKPTPTAKAIIHQKFGSNACYKVEEVQESTQNGCPGLAIAQKGPCLYRCTLQLPEFSVVSDTFKKKKDAEQSAAKMALEKLSIHPVADNPTVEEAWEALVTRVAYFFSNEFLSSLHPLSGHFRAVLRREGDLYGLIPVSVIAACDAKLNSLCKSINPNVESNPFWVILLTMKAAARLLGSIATSEGKLWIWRQNPYAPEIVQSLTTEQSSFPEDTWIEAIHIPFSFEKAVESFMLNISPTGYYVDFIAQKLGLTDASRILVSRSIGKASSETRLYFSAPDSYLLDLSSDFLNVEDTVHCKESFNVRASYFAGQDIYGDAIMASVGYKWNSEDLFHEDVSLQSYYRMLMSKVPSGAYKLSREGILTSDLPMTFTSRTNWRGCLPRDLLCAFCRQHRLSEPVFTITNIPSRASSEPSGLHKKLKVTESAKEETKCENGGGIATSERESVGSVGTFRCELKIFSKCGDLIIECSPKNSHKKQNDSIQKASLKVLSWLEMYFKELDMSSEKLKSSAKDFDIRLYPENFMKEFVLCLSVHNVKQSQTRASKFVESHCNNLRYTMPEEGVWSLKIQGPDSGVSPYAGSLLCISYAVSLVTGGEDMKELLESSDEFEFEVGIFAVIPHLESVVTQMSIGQSACFNVDLPPQELVLAAACDSASTRSLLSSKACCLEYSVTLLHLTEPLEERMEQALFSPPLSKQRVEYAVQHIKESCATTLVDYGCGSGSLIDSLLNYPTALEKIVGVDISLKSLSRAAKVLHSKLSTNSNTDLPSGRLKSAILYEGSITVFDSRLSGFDIGTCLEVIEHMEEDQACLFGDVVLGSFCPNILIVSTPNYEYNVILQGSNLPSQDEEADEKGQSQSCKFRNHDHKFEWTREQFNRWASDLATRHNYSVEFSGVGGSADLEPGFASQIAVFRRRLLTRDVVCSENADSAHHCKVIWEWNDVSQVKTHSLANLV